MKYKMSLKNEHFNEILNNNKEYEIRLNDLKRKKIKPLDIIVFKNLKNGLLIEVKVVKKIEYKNFVEMYLSLYQKSPWLCKQKLKNFKKLIYENYTKESEKKYGVIAIKIDLINHCSLKDGGRYES